MDSAVRVMANSSLNIQACLAAVGRITRQAAREARGSGNVPCRLVAECAKGESNLTEVRLSEPTSCCVNKTPRLPPRFSSPSTDSNTTTSTAPDLARSPTSTQRVDISTARPHISLPRHLRHYGFDFRAFFHRSLNVRLFPSARLLFRPTLCSVPLR